VDYQGLVPYGDKVRNECGRGVLARDTATKKVNNSFELS